MTKGEEFMAKEKDGDIDLIVVVNGQPIPIEAHAQEPLHTAAQQALNKSGNSGQPLQNWEMRAGAGNVLDLARKIGEFQFHDGTKLFLNLKAGVGG
jgi:hypothetical protein